MDSNSNGSLDTSEVAAATGLTVEQVEGSFVNSVGSDGKVTFEQFVQAMTLGSGGIDSMPDSALDIMIADMMAKLKANLDPHQHVEPTYFPPKKKRVAQVQVIFRTRSNYAFSSCQI